MNRLSPCVVFLSLVTAQLDVQNALADDLAKRREKLWQALEKALPKDMGIDVYAEDDKATRVLFRSDREETCIFSLRSGKIERVDHMKALWKINQITYEPDRISGSFHLWYNGRRELTVGAGL